MKQGQKCVSACITRMLHLRNFLRSTRWTGTVPGSGQVPELPAEQVMGRAARTLIESIADLLPSRGWEAGVRNLEKSKLSGQKYEPSSVRSALRSLKRAGLVATERTRDSRTGLEGFSTVHISPRLVELARVWQYLRIAAKNATADQRTIIKAKIEKLQNVNLPLLYEHPASPHGQGIPSDPLLNLSTHRRSKLATPNGIHAPPGNCALGPDPGGEGLVPGIPLHGREPRGGVIGHSSHPHNEIQPSTELAATDDVANDQGTCEDKLLAPVQFEKQQRARAATAAYRSARWALIEPLGRGWQPDARPVLREWIGDPSEAMTVGKKKWKVKDIDVEADPNKIRNRLVEGDQTVFFDARAFSATLDSFNEYEEDHTCLCLVRPSIEGRQMIMQGATSRAGGWPSINWQSAFRLSFARSKKLFEASGTGEQIFAMPQQNSRMVLIDDLKSPVPVLQDVKCIVLQTSMNNYQHLYCADRVLTSEERAHIQRALVGRFGGDPNATGGAQPHRVPGSVNYKPGRNLFVTRLIGTLGDIDDAKPFRADELLAEVAPAKVQPACTSADTTPATRNSMIRRGGDPKIGDQSAKDWRDGILMAARLRADGVDSADARKRVEAMLSERGRARDKHSGYAAITVAALEKHRHL